MTPHQTDILWACFWAAVIGGFIGSPRHAFFGALGGVILVLAVSKWW